MTRKLKPCGTYAAYARHLRNDEKPCDPCSAANRERASAAPSGFNNYEREMAKALDANPPKIVWRKDKHGVMRAESVMDPHAETTTAAQARRLRYAAMEAEQKEAARQAEITRLQVLQLMQDQADEVVERFRKHRADNTPLLTSARREI
jgi:hypothetical protein